MFGDTLLESSSTSRKQKRWPMATAFTVEVIIAGIVVLIPLFSTGAISMSTRITPISTPLKPVPLEAVRPVVANRNLTSAGPATHDRIVSISNNRNAIYVGPISSTNPDPGWKPTGGEFLNGGSEIPTGLIGQGPASNVKHDGPKRVISQVTEGQLIKKVEPIYPHIAVLSGIHGQVKLHAIIARDGTIESLSVTSGYPMLAAAAIEAVKQWRYHPYLLNGEAVEVETFITVNFTKDIH